MSRGMSVWILRGMRATLFSLLGLLVAFAMTAGTAEAQHRGFSGGGHAMHRGGGFGFGGWVHGNKSSFYTYNHNRGGHGASNHRHGGQHRGGAVAAFPQPYYPYVPFLGYGFTSDFNSDLNFDDNGAANTGPEYALPPQPNPGEAEMEMNQAALANQLRELHAELEDLKAAETAAPPPAPPTVAQASEPERPQPPVTLVLRNGQRLTVSDYAVMDQTFWDFSKRPVHKIPLSNIDLVASQRATAAGGGEFPALPASR